MVIFGPRFPSCLSGNTSRRAISEFLMQGIGEAVRRTVAPDLELRLHLSLPASFGAGRGLHPVPARALRGQPVKAVYVLQHAPSCVCIFFGAVGPDDLLPCEGRPGGFRFLRAAASPAAAAAGVPPAEKKRPKSIPSWRKSCRAPLGASPRSKRKPLPWTPVRNRPPSCFPGCSGWRRGTIRSAGG